MSDTRADAVLIGVAGDSVREGLMRRGLFVLLTLALLSVGRAGFAADAVTYESLTVAGTAIGITETVILPSGGDQMRVCSARLETAQIRFRFDGTNPTTSEGTILDVGDVLTIDNPADSRRIRFIRTGGTSGVLKVHCWR